MDYKRKLPHCPVCGELIVARLITWKGKSKVRWWCSRCKEQIFFAVWHRVGVTIRNRRIAK